MIFVTVGTHNQGYERLIKKMDEISSKLNEKVVMQIGTTKYEPKNAKWFRFIDYDEIINIMESSNIIICHGGAGTLLDVLKLNKPTIVVPRFKKFNEHYDDHELELAESLNKSKNILVVFNIEKLEEIISKLNTGKAKDLENDKRLVNFLKQYLRSHK